MFIQFVMCILVSFSQNKIYSIKCIEISRRANDQAELCGNKLNSIVFYRLGKCRKKIGALFTHTDTQKHTERGPINKSNLHI